MKMSTESLLVNDDCMDTSNSAYDLADVFPFGKKEDIQLDIESTERPKFTISPVPASSSAIQSTQQPNIDFVSHVLVKHLSHWTPDLATWKSFYTDIFDDSLSA